MLNNKSIIVTGVGKGLGMEILLQMVKSNAFVYGITRSKDDLKKFKNIKNCKVLYGDVKNSKTFKNILKISIKEKRIISGLVNNAGERQRLGFEYITPEKLKKLFETNFFSIFENMRLFSSYLKKRKIKGSIVNIGSIVGINGFEELAGYASSKTALIGLTKSFAKEMSDFNIRANIVNPGFIKTSYYKKFKTKKQLFNWTISRIPQKRWGTPNEVSHIVNFLISDLSSYINGTSINVDGGWLGS